MTLCIAIFDFSNNSNCQCGHQIAKDECEALRLSLSETQASSSTWEKEFRQADSRRQELAQRLSQTELNLTAMREALENACAEKDVALRSADEQLDQVNL